MTQVISRIDHVVIEAEDERAVFDFFHERLGLPVAWPMAQWGPIHEGGINIGNCNIGCNHKLDPNSPDEPRIVAVGFEPHGGLNAALGALDLMGFEHSEPIPSGEIDLPYAPWNAGWTNVMLFRPTPVSFLCEYHHDAAERRRAAIEALAASPNPLGIRGILNTHSNTTDWPGWELLLADGYGTDEGTYFDYDDSIGAGVDEDYYWGLTFDVASLDQAASALGNLGIGFQEGIANWDGLDRLDSLQLNEEEFFGEELYVSFCNREEKLRRLRDEWLGLRG